LIFDTSIILQVLKDERFIDKLEGMGVEDIAVASITAYELLRGAAYLARRGSERELRVIVRMLSELQVIPFTYEDARIASLLWSKLRERGTSVNDADILIASISLRRGDVLVSLDEDFQRIKEVEPSLELVMLRP